MKMETLVRNGRGGRTETELTAFNSSLPDDDDNNDSDDYRLSKLQRQRLEELRRHRHPEKPPTNTFSPSSDLNDLLTNLFSKRRNINRSDNSNSSNRACHGHASLVLGTAATVMTSLFGISQPLPVSASEYDFVKSTSLLSSPSLSLSTTMAVKIDDYYERAANTNSKKISLGVKIEYYPEEIIQNRQQWNNNVDSIQVEDEVDAAVAEQQQQPKTINTENEELNGKAIINKGEAAATTTISKNYQRQQSFQLFQVIGASAMGAWFVHYYSGATNATVLTSSSNSLSPSNKPKLNSILESVENDIIQQQQQLHHNLDLFLQDEEDQELNSCEDFDSLLEEEEEEVKRGEHEGEEEMIIWNYETLPPPLPPLPQSPPFVAYISSSTTNAATITVATVSPESYLDSLANRNQFYSPKSRSGGGGSGFQSFIGNLGSTAAADATTVSTGSYLDSLANGNKFDSRSRSGGGSGFQSYLGTLNRCSAPSSVVEGEQYQNNEVEELPLPSPPSFASDRTSFTANAERQIVDSKSGRRLSITAEIFTDLKIDRVGYPNAAAPPPPNDQSSTRLRLFGTRNHSRRHRSTRLYLSTPSDYEEEPSMFPKTAALIEILRQKKLDRLDAEFRARQQAEQEAIEAAVLKAKQEEDERFLAEQRASLLSLKLKQEEEERLAAERRALEEAERRARVAQERFLSEQRAREEAVIKMQEQMQRMAAEKKAREEAELRARKAEEERRAKEEAAMELKIQQSEESRLAAEQRASNEAILRAWEEEEELLLLEEKAKEEAEMKLFEDRLAAELRAKEEAEVRAREEEEFEARLLLEQKQRAREEAIVILKQQHEREHSAAVQIAIKQALMRLEQENADLLAMDQNMSFLIDALAGVDVRLHALNNEGDIDQGIQHLNLVVSEIDSLLSEDGYY
jgi:hypothetical protein